MKKQVIISVMLIAVCLTLWGCAGQSEKNGQNDLSSVTKSSVIESDDTFEIADSFDYVNDHQYQFDSMLLSDDHNTARSEKGYYFNISGYLMFYNESTGITDYVCSVPGCKHRSTKNDPEYDVSFIDLDSCNAHIGINCGIYYNSGNIYYGRCIYSDNTENKYEIVRLSTDGSNRKVLAEIPIKGTFDIYTYIKMIAHRGYLYYSVSYVTDDTEAMHMRPESTALYRLDLNNDKAQPEIWLDSTDFEEIGNPVISEMSAYGNKLFFRKETYSLMNYPDVADKRRFPMFWVDIDSKKITDMGEHYEMPEEATQLNDFTFLNDNLLLRLWNKDGLSKELYTLSFDGLDVKKFFTLPDNYSCLISDAQYIYIIGPTYNPASKLSDYKNALMTVRIYDHRMKLINTADVFVGDNYKVVRPQSESNDINYFTNSFTQLVGSNRTVFTCADDKLMICGVIREDYHLPSINSIPTEYYPYVKFIEKKELLKKDGNLLCKEIFVSEQLTPYDS